MKEDDVSFLKWFSDIIKSLIEGRTYVKHLGSWQIRWWWVGGMEGDGDDGDGDGDDDPPRPPPVTSRRCNGGGWVGWCVPGWVGPRPRVQLILRFETGSLVIATGRRDHDTDVDGGSQIDEDDDFLHSCSPFSSV